MAAEHREAKKGHIRIDVFTVLLAVLVAVLIALIAYSELSNTPATSISSLQLYFKPNTTFSLDGVNYIAYAHSFSGNGTAVIYLERQPVMLNPVLAINVSDTSGTFISPVLGHTATMEMKLISATNRSVRISVSYINPGLSIPVSSASIHVLQHVALPAPTTHTSNSTATTNTSSSPSPSNKTSTNTTTVSNVNMTQEKIMAIAKNYSLFTTLQDYAAAYSNLSKCTPALYNSTYDSKVGSYPSGPNSYYNVSNISPYSMSHIIKYVNPSTYSLVFNTTSYSSATTGTAAIIYVDTVNSSISGYKLEGAYAGQTIASMQSNYINYTKIGGYCSVLI